MKQMKLKIRDARKMHSVSRDSKFDLPSGLEELTSEEAKNIIAGESVAFWLGYIGGKIANLFS